MEAIRIRKQELGTQQESLPNSKWKSDEIIEKYGNRKDFLVSFNPDVQMDICSNDDFCFFGSAPTLGEVNAAYGEKTAAMWLVPQLTNLSEFCGCKEKLDGSSLKECARLIANVFYFLKVSELMLFFYRFKSGRYGRFYGSVDPLVITESLRKFCEERLYAYELHDMEERERKDLESRKQAVSWEEWNETKKRREHASSNKPI